MDHLQEQPCHIFPQLEQEPFIDDQECKLGVFLQRVFKRMPILRSRQVYQKNARYVFQQPVVPVMKMFLYCGVHDWPTFEFKAKKYQRAEYILGWLNFFANIKGIKSFNRLIDFQYNHFYRKEYLKDCIEFLSKYDTIYSTRLHIMIAAAMLGKQVYVIDNTYGKNISLYNTWLKDLDNVEPM